MVNKIITPPTTSELIGKVNEIIDAKQDVLTAGTGIDITNDVISVTNAISTGAALGATAVQPSALNGYATENYVTTAVSGKQDTLVSGTNIKTINGNSLLGSGNIEIQGGGGAYTAGDGIDITSNTISIKSSIINGAELGTTALQVGDNVSDLNNDSGYIQNVATDPGSLAILGSIAPNVWDSISIGKDSVAAGPGVLAIGYEAIASGYYAIQLGRGTNSTDYSFSVGFAGVNFQLLDGTTGLIPDARISSNIARSADIPTTTSDLTNDSGFITSSALNGYATENWVNNKGYLTGINSSDVTSALGYTPYNATNPNGYITSSALNGYALDTDVVHKTGTETITGEKIFTSKLRIDSGGIEITPELSASHGGYIDFHYAGSTDDYTSRIIENSQGNIAIKSTTVTAPASDVNDSIVTTVNKSKATNGYFQLGNGLIIQWGRISITVNNATGSVTFPKAFTSTNYSITAAGRRSAGNGQGEISITETYSTTGFSWRSNATASYYNNQQFWIAIGY